MQIAFAIIGFECLPAAKCYMCTHKPIFSGPQTLWKWVSHCRCVGNESLAAQQPCKPCLFRSGRLVWFQSLSGLPVRRRGDSWIAMVGRHPARQKPQWRLAVWAQLALQHLVTFISMPLTPGLLVLLIWEEHVRRTSLCSPISPYLSLRFSGPNCFLYNENQLNGPWTYKSGPEELQTALVETSNSELWFNSLTQYKKPDMWNPNRKVTAVRIMCLSESWLH